MKMSVVIVIGRAGRRRGEGEVIVILMILMDVGRERVRGLPRHLILTLAILMIPGLVEEQSGLKRRAESIDAKKFDSKV
ncbi:hypothetical protein FRX31_014817 [Thalictrum thalictroides]|uniref:Uncharacterized protein n=1 Tax=Thalictrum thalictroides TaxID=46969 RepID=A0A7J6WDS2_THATH|nr:hypothetical protein FRX31_014817 [Thalictrum thalictroides]